MQKTPKTELDISLVPQPDGSTTFVDGSFKASYTKDDQDPDSGCLVVIDDPRVKTFAQIANEPRALREEVLMHQPH